jgi:hypothetical protein
MYLVVDQAIRGEESAAEKPFVAALEVGDFASCYFDHHVEILADTDF